MATRYVWRSFFLACSLCMSRVTLCGGADLVADWPEFRGPTGQGIASATGLPIEWSETQNVRWKAELPGRGWSSPVVAGNHIWLTTAFETEVDEQERQAALAKKKNADTLAVSGQVRLHALCVSRETGELLQNVELIVKDQPQPVHKMNSFASPTPILAAGRLYCCFGSYGTACLDTESGAVLWRNSDIEVEHENGPGSTPVLWQDKLIYHCDGSDQQFIVALDAESGKIAWRTARSGKLREDPQLKKAYGTPLLVERAGRTILVSPSADWVYAYDPANGSELWKMNYGELGFSTVPRPVAANGYLFVVTGFMNSRLIAYRLADDPRLPPEEVWLYDKQVPRIPSPLYADRHVLIVSDSGIATCLDAESGSVQWRQRLTGNFAASPLWADGRVYLSDREGVTTVMSLDGTVLARNELPEGMLASPIAVNSSLYLRTESALYRVESLP